MSSIIYYFTGTGNCLKVAKDLTTELKDTKLIRISRNTLGERTSEVGDKVGFVFPNYFSGMPFLVTEFVEGLKLNPSTYVFAIVTYGATIGATLSQLEKVLSKKGVKLSGQFGISMPGNYQVAYKPFTVEKQQKRFKKQSEMMKQIAMSIRNNEIVKHGGLGQYIKRPIDGLIMRFFKPHQAGENFWTDEKCNGCGTCSKVCPANNIKMSSNKPQWGHNCEQCLACMQWCPKQSIQYKKVTLNRERYNHPDIKLQELLQTKDK